MTTIEEKFIAALLLMFFWLSVYYVLDLLFGLDAALMKLSYWVWP